MTRTDFIIKAEENHLASDVGETTEVSWKPPTSMTYQEWSAIGATFQQINRSLNWWIGDWLNAGEMRFGEMAVQAVEGTGRAVESLIKYKQVSQRIPPHMRYPELSWTHHFSVAWLPDINERAFWLDICHKVEMTAKDLRYILRLNIDQYRFVRTRVRNDMVIGEIYKLIEEAKIKYPTNNIAKGTLTNLTNYTPAANTVNLDPLRSIPTEDIYKWFDSFGVPVKGIYQNHVLFEGMKLLATVDNDGTPILLWEAEWSDE